MSLLGELKGKRCAVVFTLPDMKWPFPGYPAWLTLYDQDGFMLKMGYTEEDAIWLNASIIQSIRP